jgi:peroxiredoxin Q/BCP
MKSPMTSMKPRSVLLLGLLITLAPGIRPLAGAQPVADFELPSADGGKPFKLSEHRGHYVALHFLLKTECPFCLNHTHDHARKANLLPNVEHVFIKPDSEEAIRAWIADLPPGTKERAVLYRDADATLAEIMKIPGGYPFHGERMHYPALILIDPKGNEVFRYVGRNNSDRYSFDQLAAKLQELEPNRAVVEYNLPKDGIALGGYDPVAYFTQGQAVKGVPGIQVPYRGAHYQFASQTSLDQFIADPKKYLPTYGGWCATAMARGEKVEIDPSNFKVSNGRLFLFYKGLWGNARKDWDKDEPGQMAKADAAWQKISGE